MRLLWAGCCWCGGADVCKKIQRLCVTIRLIPNLVIANRPGGGLIVVALAVGGLLLVRRRRRA